MLTENVERPLAPWVSVEVMGQGGFEGCLAFDHFEAVGGHQERARRCIVAMVGSAYSLDETLDVLDLCETRRFAPPRSSALVKFLTESVDLRYAFPRDR